MRTFPKWSQEEDERLLALISENQGNLQKAFRLFHEEFPIRTVKATNFRWYGVLRLRNTTNVCMLTAQKEDKEVSSETPEVDYDEEESSLSLWERIKLLLRIW